MVDEVWKDIPGYEGFYQASNFGRIRSVEHYDKLNRLRKATIRKQQKDNGGYLFVIFSKNGEKKQINTHRIIAMTFILNPNNLPQVNHKDENKTNNCVENLEWCNSKYNANYGNRNKKMIENLSGKNNKKSKKIEQYDLQGNFIKDWIGIRDVARKTNIKHQNISACCVGKQKTAGGYIWRYVND